MPTYQVRHGDYRWEDKELPITSLQNLAWLISASFAELGDKLINEDLANLQAYVLDYHGVQEDYQRKNRGIFDVCDVDFNVDSFDADVLKISYHFTIRYNSDRDPDYVKGFIKFME